MDNHFRVSEKAMRELERQGMDVKQWQANLQKETRNGNHKTLTE